MQLTNTETQKVYMQTFGCQMNVRDSEGVRGLLAQSGYDFTDEMEDAQIILFNTCSVRQHAEDRIFGRSGILTKVKKKRPDTIIGIMGCMAQEHGSKFFRRMPSLDLVCGPGNMDEIPELIKRIATSKTQITAIDRINETRYNMDDLEHRSHSSKAFVNIMSGCDHKCTYCIVPMTRGIERSREPKDIVNEVKGLVDRGYQDIMLLGQNVNCYGKKLDQPTDFVDLLERIDRIAKPNRIRFTTSHPKDAHLRLFEAMRDVPSVCEHLHLPVQSGSSRILRRMKREHNREWFLDRVDEFKATLPNGSITSDLIVGFCGETDEDFKETMSLVEKVQFDSSYMFKYSPRPGTPAMKLEDDVPQIIKDERLQRLMQCQKSVTLENNSRVIGQTVEVLFEEYYPEKSGKATGRTREFKRVVVQTDKNVRDQILSVQVEQAMNETLLGSLKD
ncbi:MAG: tRNA-2-methylthio-N6-dimethylallyladenosine synthase [Candidatus Omnitrophota bacterium]|jgi:tRNA-2-methylthio-N6-dimethylallyladenosine synthase